MITTKVTKNYSFSFFPTDHGDAPGLREKLLNIKDRNLKRKAESLPVLLEAAYAKSTLRKYKPAWEKWLICSDPFDEVISCPADPIYVAIYINDLTNSFATEGALTAAILGIRWGHLNSGFDSPTNHPLVRLAIEGGKRIIAERRSPLKNCHRKEPLSSDLIKNLVRKYSTSTNLVDIRFLIMVLFGFAGFFRISEILKIQLKEITFDKSGATVYLPFSKTDQVREGNIVFISKTDTECCPIYWLRKYLALSGLRHKPEAYLICHLYKTKTSHNVHSHRPISYTTALSTFKDHISKMTDPTIYGLHSLRSGGASEAANNGISDRLISKHGRWSSNTSRNTYIKDKAETRFRVSR
uniref:Tyr recombinase domain-containing protein n=1 Tax=Clytia hemisphaerica TaxID=252671 RepID=A0A7M5XJT8_9CNID